MKFVLNFSFLNPILSCVRNGYLHLSLYLLERCLSVLKTHECITVLAINQDWMFIAGPRRKCISGINRMVWENVSLRKFVFTGAKSEYHSTFSVKSSFFPIRRERPRDVLIAPEFAIVTTWSRKWPSSYDCLGGILQGST